MIRVLIFLVISISANAQDQKEIFTMFYNVENLFDTIDDPHTNDNEFLPNSKKKWDNEKYNHKINQLTKVFSAINDGALPNLIGLCEVENKEVIYDLLKTPFFENNNYTIIHQNSPDARGIDCAILFDNNFKLLSYDFIEVKIPNKRATRDIVYVQLGIEDEIINIFINHWPSRWGGTEETEHKRVFTSNILRKYIDKNIDKDERVIVMGDLNDYPSNKSIKGLIKDDLINLMELIEGQEIGSYSYNNQWNFIDHIIVSNDFFDDHSKLRIKEFNTFKKEWMIYTNKNGKSSPSRTYGRSKWFGGFSDHLPIFCVFNLIY